MQLIVHGGAGSTPDEPDARRAVLQEAADVGTGADTPLDAVVAAVGILEESPRFNAGVGGAVQADGAVRTDAGVMTDGLDVGAVCALPGVVRGAAVARFVLEHTPHVLLAGEHARRAASLASVDTEADLLTDASRSRYAEADPPVDEPAATLDWVREHFGTDDSRRQTVDPPDGDHDTVGAVAVDDGALAAATSTGGRWFALPGRVGDTPQVGAGFYASPAGGASATGHGEDIARLTLARDAVRRLENGEAPQAAAERSVDRLGETTGGDAGIILADNEGRVGSAYNTDLMQIASARG